MPEVNVVFEPPPTLARFWESNAYIRCCVGPVGSGKSSACVTEILRRACEQAPGPDGIRHSRFAVVRNTYRELEDTTRKTFEQWVPDALGYWVEQDFMFVMEFSDVRSEILFRSCDSPKDIKKLLSLELTGAYINEVREVPKQILDMLSTRVGRYPSKKDGGPTWRGIWMDTNPWHSGHWGQKFFEDVEKTPRGLLDELGLASARDYAQCFRQPGARSPQAENLENLEAGYYARQMIGKDAEWIRIYVDGEDAAAAEGSVYGKQISALKQRGGLTDFEHRTDEVFTTWDLGIADSMAIWWWRFNAQGGVDLIDWYENHSEALSHYFTVVDDKPYQYLKHWLPHDARARSLQTGKSTIEQVSGHFGAAKVGIVPQLDVDQGIEAARWLLEQQGTRFHARCDDVPQGKDYSGVGTLAEYRYEFDEIRKVFSKIPVHDFASHTGDAFRYVACVARASGFLAKKPDPTPEPPVARDPSSFTLSELWATAPKASKRRHI